MKEDEKWLKKKLTEIDHEIEDKAWEKKRAEYGEKFNASKFYELDAFWPNFWALFWVLVPFFIGGFFIIRMAVSETKKADANAMRVRAEAKDEMDRSLWR